LSPLGDNYLSLDLTDNKCISGRKLPLRNRALDTIKAQIKAARVLAGLTQAELCESAGIPLITLRRIEGKPEHKGLVSQDTVDAVKAALEQVGIQFLEPGEKAEGMGVAVRGG
jgi:DNA-binding XRE family transcriptional regulator